MSLAASMGTSATVAQTTLADFQFNEGTGLSTHSPTNDLTGVFGIEADPANFPVSTTDTPSGKDGDRAVQLLNNAFLTVDDSSNPVLALRTNALTIEAWLKRDSASTHSFEGIAAYGASYKMALYNSQLRFTLFGVVDVDSGLFVTSDVWQHAAAAWEPGVGVTFYLDDQTAFVADTKAMRAFGHNVLSIGAEGQDNNLQGILDRVRIHQGLLTADQLDGVAATPKAPLSNTLVAYSFNETTMPYQNAKAPARPTIMGTEFITQLTAPAFVKDSPTGGSTDYSLDFSRVGTRIRVSDLNQAISLDPGDFTVQAWVKFGAQPAEKSVLLSNNGPGGAISFSIAGRALALTAYGVLDLYSVASVPDDGSWHHVAAVHQSGKEVRFYVDGILGDTVAFTGGLLINVRTDDHFWIGGEDWGSGTMGYSYVGKLDRFSISQGIVAVEKLDFRPIPGVDPSAPQLNIQTVVEIAWATLPAGYKLQSTTDAGNAASWAFITGVPITTEGKYIYYAPITGTKTFYRLVKP